MAWRLGNTAMAWRLGNKLCDIASAFNERERERLSETRDRLLVWKRDACVNTLFVGA
jgi:hypothetical protein